MFSIIKTAELKRLREHYKLSPSELKCIDECNAMAQELYTLKNMLRGVGFEVAQDQIQMGNGRLHPGIVTIEKTFERKLKEWCIEMAFKSPGASNGNAMIEAERIYEWIISNNKDLPGGVQTEGFKKDAA